MAKITQAKIPGLITDKGPLLSTLEAGFATVWTARHSEQLPAPEREYRFDASRKWAFDFAWPDAQLAVELHGGQFARGRHQRSTGFARDLEKMNAAQVNGWCVLQFTTKDLEARPVQVVDFVASILWARLNPPPGAFKEKQT